MDNPFAPIYGGKPEQPKRSPSPAETFGSMFRLGNDMYNALDLMTREETPPADPTFDYRQHFDDTMPEEWRPMLAESRSVGEFEQRLARIRQEALDREILASSGTLTSLAAGLAAGALSPTMLIPFAGQARGVMAFGEVLGLAAIAGTLQESALYMNQELMDESEFATGVAMQTLLAGAMGGAWLGMTKSGRARFLREFEENSRFMDVPEGPMDMGVPASRERIRFEDGPETPQARMSREADVGGRDVVATAKARIEPDLPTAGSRYYFSGNLDDVTARIVGHLDREKAQAVAPDSPLYYIDLDRNALPTRADAMPEELTLTPAQRERLTEVYRGQEPSTEVGIRPDQGEAPSDLGSDGMVPSPRERAISEGLEVAGSDARQSAGAAAASRPVNASGVKQGQTRLQNALLKALGKISPQYRMGTSQFASIRDAIFRLDSSGLQQAGLDTMQPSGMGGSVRDRLPMHDYQRAQALESLSRHYYRYLYGKDPGAGASAQELLAQIKSRVVAPPEGKMSWPEFDEAVYDAVTTGKVPDELSDVVPDMHNFYKYFEDLNEAYHKEVQQFDPDAAPLFRPAEKSDLGAGVENYAHQRWDQEKLTDRMDEFINDVAGWIEQGLKEDYSRAYDRFSRQRANVQFEIEFGKLSPEAKAAQLEEGQLNVLALEETPEMLRYYEDLKAFRETPEYQQADKSTRAKLTKEFNANLDEDVRAMRSQTQAAKARVRKMQELGGEDSAKMVKLQEEIDKSEELLSGMLTRLAPRLAKIDTRVARTKQQFDKLYARTKADIEKAYAGIERLQSAHIRALENSRGSEAVDKALDRLRAQRSKYSESLKRLEEFGAREEYRDAMVEELNQLREAALSDLTHLAKRRAQRAVEAEESLEGLQAKQLSPEERGAYLARKESELADLEREFELTWAERGDQSGNPTAGRPDFLASSIEHATTIYQKMSKSDVEPMYMMGRADRMGPQLERTLNLPYDIKKKYLDRSMEQNINYYSQRMGADLELYRALDGSPNGSKIFEAMQQEAHAYLAALGTSKYVKLPANWVDKSKRFGERVKDRLAEFEEGSDLYLSLDKFSQEPKAGYIELTDDLRQMIARNIQSEITHQQRNFDVAIQRLRGIRNRPANKNSFMWRSGRVWKDLNVLTMMGMVTISSMPDMVRVMFGHSAAKVVGKSWAPNIQNIKSLSGVSFRTASREANARIGLTLEPRLQSRAKELLDLADDYAIGRSKAEQGISFLADKAGIVGLFSFQTAMNKRITADVVHATMGEYIPTAARALASGKVDGEAAKMLEYLRQRGLTDLDIHRIGVEFERPGGLEKFSNGGVIPNFDAWENPAAFRAYAGAVAKEVNKLVITPGLERPNWTDENLAYSLLAQFQSFLFGATSRMLMSGIQGGDPYVAQGVIASLAMGALAYYLSGVSRGGKAYEDVMNSSPGKWLYMGIDRSGLLGALAIGQGIGAEIGGLNEYWLFGAGEPDQFRGGGRAVAAAGGPITGQLLKFGELAQDLSDPKKKKQNLMKARRLFVPYQNNFLLRQPLDRVGEALETAIGA